MGKMPDLEETTKVAYHDDDRLIPLNDKTPEKPTSSEVVQTSVAHSQNQRMRKLLPRPSMTANTRTTKVERTVNQAFGLLQKLQTLSKRISSPICNTYSTYRFLSIYHLAYQPGYDAFEV